MLSNMKVRLSQALKLFQLRFKQMETGKESLAEMLSFVKELGLISLKSLHEDEYELHIRLE
jgi:hypothetical protein